MSLPGQPREPGGRDTVVPPGAERTFGPTGRQVVARIAAPVVGTVVGVAVVAAGSTHVSPDQVVVLPLAALVVQLLLLSVHRRQGITVSRQGVVVRQGFRTTRKAWGDVVAVEQRRRLGTSCLLLRTEYGTLSAPCPRSSSLVPDADFTAKAEGVRHWWATGRR